MLLTVNIANFGSYFALFAGLNLGYATSQSFRDAIDNEVLKIGEKTLNAKIISLQARYNALIIKSREANKDFMDISHITKKRSSNFNSTVNSNLKATNSKTRNKASAIKSPAHTEAENNLAEINMGNSTFHSAIAELDVRRGKEAEFIEGFKSMFLITTFFCLTLLFLAGMQNDPYNCYYINVVNLLSAFIIPFNIYMFARSHGKASNKKIKPIIITYIFFSIVLFAIAFNFFENAPKVGTYFSTELCMSIACFVAISPYIIHFIRAYYHRQAFKPIEAELIRINEAKVEEWDAKFKRDEMRLETEKYVIGIYAHLKNKDYEI